MSSRAQLQKFAAALPTDAEVRDAAHDHQPKLVVSSELHGEGILDRIADVVSALVGSMYLFVAVTLGVVAWLFAGNVVGFDKTPWPLLLTILNLPQLSIMISLQVAANRAQTASDARALADHQTLIAINEMNKRQLKILDDQNKILDLLQQRANTS
ncbi:MAG TPA: hypothetical protein VIN56_04465 [Candidatus Dormibacteraeota bacterium]|jgi:uncharacterized membrane protein